MPQDGGQQQHAPQPADRVIITSVAASLAERIEEFGVGDAGEQFPHGLQAGAILQAFPGEQRSSGGDAHGVLLRECPLGDASYYATNPRTGRRRVEKTRKTIPSRETLDRIKSHRGETL